VNNSTAQEILEKIRSSKNILINMDTRTDFDALASSVVLNTFIRSLGGINTTIIHSRKLRKTFQGYFPYDEVQEETDVSDIDLSEFDLAIFLDSGLEEHISINKDFNLPEGLTTINIDHHTTNDMFGDLNYVYHLGSCCSVLYKFFGELEVKLSVEQLETLAVGLLTDTGFLRYNSTTPEDFRIVAEFVERGVKLWEIISKLTDYEHIDQLKYREIVLKNLVVDFEKKFAYSTVSLAELKERKINLSNVFINSSDLIKYIIGVDFAFVISELGEEPKQFKLSFRSKDPEIDVSKMVGKFGGGGHKSAAGAVIEGPQTLDEAVNTVLTTLALN